MNYAEIIRDFRTKYRHTYVFLDLPGQADRSLAYIEEVGEGNGEDAIAQISLNALNLGRLSINFASVGRVKFRFPAVGTFQLGRDSVLIQRLVPNRQYTRGVCSTNHWMGFAMQEFDRRNPRWDLVTVQAAYDGKKCHAREAVDILNKGQHRSIALPGRWTMSLPVDDKPEFMLLHDINYVGRVSSKLDFTPARGAEVFEDEARRILGEF